MEKLKEEERKFLRERKSAECVQKLTSERDYRHGKKRKEKNPELLQK